MEFLRRQISYSCGVIYGYGTRNTMSVESFPSNKPQSVAGCHELIDQIVFSTEPKAFCGAGKVVFKNSFS